MVVLQLAAVYEFEATEAIIDGVPFLIIPAAALKGLYRKKEAEPAAAETLPTAAVKPASPVKRGRPRKAAVKTETAEPQEPKSAVRKKHLAPQRAPRETAAAVVAERPATESGGETFREKILASLGKKPKTSKELLDEFPAGSGTIYTLLSEMRKDGSIETKQDESDGMRKNFAA